MTQKKGNIVPVHKKQNINYIKNYRPLILLAILIKIFEMLVFNAFFLNFLFKISCFKTINLVLFQEFIMFYNYYL